MSIVEGEASDRESCVSMVQCWLSLLLNLARVTSLSVAESARIGASVSVASGLVKTPIFNKSGDNMIKTLIKHLLHCIVAVTRENILLSTVISFARSSPCSPRCSRLLL